MRFAIALILTASAFATDAGSPKIEDVQKQLAAAQAEVKELRAYIETLQQWQASQVTLLNGALNGCLNVSGKPPQTPAVKPPASH